MKKLRLMSVFLLITGLLIMTAGLLTACAQGELTVLPVPGAGLQAKLQWLKENAQSDTEYLIEVDKDETLSGINPGDTTGLNYLDYDGKTGVIVHLAGRGGRRIVSLEGTGILFMVQADVTLVLDHNLTLKGHYGNTTGVSVAGGTLIMNEGAEITGNMSSGVNVSGGGTFTMNGGTISGNTATSGGGVYVNGTPPEEYFKWNGGTISGNTPDNVAP